MSNRKYTKNVIVPITRTSISKQQQQQQQSIKFIRQIKGQKYKEQIQLTFQQQQQDLLKNIQIKSYEIIKPQFDCSLYQKHHIVFIFQSLFTSQQKKLVKNISQIYSAILVHQWKEYQFKNKIRQQYPYSSIRKSNSLYTQSNIQTKYYSNANDYHNNINNINSYIFVISQQFQKIGQRQLKINPATRIILLKKSKIQQLYQPSNNHFILVTNYQNQIQDYLKRNKTILIPNNK